MPTAHSIPSRRRRAGEPRGFSRILQFLRGDVRFSLLVGWLTLVFLLGGSSRADMPTLQIIRPLSLLVIAYGLALLRAEDFRRNRFILILAAAWLGLLLLQLVPLPPEIWRSFGGREVVHEIGQATALGDNVWRPLSMAPYATWNAFWASITPAAVLVLGAGLDRDGLCRLVPVLGILVFLSFFVGLLQIVGDPYGPLYFYRFTHHGVPVGLLANRNHQAALLACALPLLAVWAASRSEASGNAGSSLRLWLPIFGGTIALLLMILLTGSRSGTLIAMFGLLALGAMLAERAQPKRAGGGRQSRRMLLACLFLGGLAAIVLLAMVLGRAVSFDRVASSEVAEDMRVRILPTVLAMIGTYLPWGAGIGTFQPVYRMHEPDKLLSSFYMNQAHNDWLDLALAGGIPALILLAAFFVGLAARLPAAISGGELADRRLVRLGLASLAMLGMASVTDYPLRVPSMACLAAIALLWTNAAHSQRSREFFASAKI